MALPTGKRLVGPDQKGGRPTRGGDEEGMR